MPIAPTGDSPGLVGSFMYNTDGNRVMGTVNGVTVVYIAGLYEWQAGATTTYYDGGAMRRSGHASDNGVFYVLADHLGSTSVIVSQTGVEMSREYHYPYGANRGSAFSELTTKRFTGQYHEAGLAGMEGLSYYNARWYDPQVGRFASADTIVPRPGEPQDFNRYSYALNNPLKHTDPTGHDVGCGGRDCNDPRGGGDRNPARTTPKPRIIPRNMWGAWTPGVHTKCGFLGPFCQTSGQAEGRYDPITNPGGYAPYSELSPHKSLDEILESVVIHHEGDSQDYDIRKVQEQHMFGEGWYDIGYHYVIGPGGTIYEGRDLAVRGSHVEGANSHRIGVLLLGDFEPGTTIDFKRGTTIVRRITLPVDLYNGDDPGPTDAQVYSAYALVQWLDVEYGIDAVVGHREVNDTQCPGANSLWLVRQLSEAVR